MDQAQVALLDQVEQRQASRLVLLGDRDHQAQVGVDERLRRLVTCIGGPQQLAPPAARELAACGQLGACLPPCLDGLGEADLVILREQLVATDLIQVQANEVLLPLAVWSPRGLLPHYSSVGELRRLAAGGWRAGP